MLYVCIRLYIASINCCRDGPNESDYTFSGAAETYQGNEPAAEDSDSDSSFPDSPHRLLTQGFSGDTKSNGRQTIV